MSKNVIHLQDRPVYGFGQVDRILGLKPSTAERWIDGYRRGGKAYPPVVRPEHTGDEVVTWGEFIEARLLAQYRDEGALVAKMRLAVEKLREELNIPYPLASAKTWLSVSGRELVRDVQDEVGLDRRLLLVVVSNDQQILDWSPQAQEFADSLHCCSSAAADPPDGDLCVSDVASEDGSARWRGPNHNSTKTLY